MVLFIDEVGWTSFELALLIEKHFVISKMNIFKLLSGIFLKQTVATTSYRSSERLAELKSKFGYDFSAFLYRPNIDKIIKQELLPFLEAPRQYNGFLDVDHWLEKHPFNFPGPFFTGQSDSCGTGDIEAPDNVLYDSNCYEYIFKQPSSFEELLCVFDAAAVEAFDSYACIGNNYWTYSICKEWWRGKDELIEQLNTHEVKKMNGDRVQLYLDYLNTDAEVDLRRYCFFLENNFYPANDSVLLPDL
jgi:hypothetical protein